MNLFDFINIGCTIVTVVFTIYNIHYTKRKDIGDFISEYESMFLSVSEFQEVDKKLEKCNHYYKEYMKNEISEESFIEKCRKVFNLENPIAVDDIRNPSNIINQNATNPDEEVVKNYIAIKHYMQWMESLVASFVLKGLAYIPNFEQINATFGYRFFLAVNNPVIQENLLFLEPEFFDNCIENYEYWFKYKRGRFETIPLADFSLDNRRYLYDLYLGEITKV